MSGRSANTACQSAVRPSKPASMSCTRPASTATTTGAPYSAARCRIGPSYSKTKLGSAPAARSRRTRATSAKAPDPRFPQPPFRSSMIPPALILPRRGGSNMRKTQICQNFAAASATRRGDIGADPEPRRAPASIAAVHSDLDHPYPPSGYVLAVLVIAYRSRWAIARRRLLSFSYSHRESRKGDHQECQRSSVRRKGFLAESRTPIQRARRF